MAEKEKHEQPEEIIDETILEEEDASKNENSSNKKEKTKISSTELEAELAAAQTRADKAEETAAELKDSLLRTAAEYDNFRKRSQKEQESSFSNGVSFSAKEMLPILDTLDAAANAPTDDEEYKKGILMTLTKCNEVFAKLGIQEIPALGEPFNPEFHNAVMQQPQEGVESGIVTQVMQKGYMLNDKVIRHSMVAVAP